MASWVKQDPSAGRCGYNSQAWKSGVLQRSQLLKRWGYIPSRCRLQRDRFASGKEAEKLDFSSPLRHIFKNHGRK